MSGRREAARILRGGAPGRSGSAAAARGSRVHSRRRTAAAAGARRAGGGAPKATCYLRDLNCATARAGGGRGDARAGAAAGRPAPWLRHQFWPPPCRRRRRARRPARRVVRSACALGAARRRGRAPRVRRRAERRPVRGSRLPPPPHHRRRRRGARAAGKTHPRRRRARRRERLRHAPPASASPAPGGRPTPRRRHDCAGGRRSFCVLFGGSLPGSCRDDEEKDGVAARRGAGTRRGGRGRRGTRRNRTLSSAPRSARAGPRAPQGRHAARRPSLRPCPPAALGRLLFSLGSSFPGAFLALAAPRPRLPPATRRAGTRTPGGENGVLLHAAGALRHQVRGGARTSGSPCMQARAYFVLRCSRSRQPRI